MRCLSCAARILEDTAGVHRCSSCGRAGEGRPDREEEWSPFRPEAAAVEDAPAQRIDLFRVCLLSSTTFVPVAMLREVRPVAA